MCVSISSWNNAQELMKNHYLRALKSPGASHSPKHKGCRRKIWFLGITREVLERYLASIGKYYGGPRRLYWGGTTEVLGTY